MSSIYVYWDESHFWGLLLIRALRAWGVPHRLVRAKAISQGALDRKPAALMVPGGYARGKAAHLGPEGMDAIRRYVDEGGTYIGFCGGAGLALSESKGLGLSPWKRRRFKNRLQHFLSGHMHVRLADHQLIPKELGGEALIPVWWPGQFDDSAPGPEPLAVFDTPGPDVWMADMHLKSLPEGTVGDWENLYGISLRPDFIKGRPGIAANAYGQGRVILSYAHLETPASPQANYWLGSMLADILGIEPNRAPLPAWDLASRPVRWHHPVLEQAAQAMDEIIETGNRHFLLFWRTPWLLGWRRGIPGSGINALYALIHEIMASEPNAEAEQYLLENGGRTGELVDLFRKGVTGYLLAERLGMTVLHSGPDAITPETLRNQRNSLFGKPPAPGGLYEELLRLLEDLYFLLSRGVSATP